MALSPVQTQKLTTLFHLLDVDGNGVIERADHAQIVVRLGRLRGWEADSPEHGELGRKMMAMWERLAEMAPADDQGRVSLGVWIDWHERRLSADFASMEVVFSGSDLALDLIDIDQDGMLSRGEYRLFYDVYGIDAEQVDEIFARLDINADGFITEDEINRLIRDFYFSTDERAPGSWFFGPF